MRHSWAVRKRNVLHSSEENEGSERNRHHGSEEKGNKNSKERNDITTVRKRKAASRHRGKSRL